MNRRRLLSSVTGAIWLSAALAACDRAEPPTPDTGTEGSARATGVSVPTQSGDPTLPSELAPTGATSAQRAASSADPERKGPPPDPADDWSGPFFTVTKIAAGIYAEPKFDKKQKIGYVRNGGRVPVKQEPVSKAGCSGGWYQLASGGYVCGNLGTTKKDDPSLKFAITQPNLDEVLPYTYARNAKNGTPLYKSVPTRDQMLRYEPYLPAAKKKAEEARKKAEAEAKAANANAGAEAKDEPEDEKKAERDDAEPEAKASTAASATTVSASIEKDAPKAPAGDREQAASEAKGERSESESESESESDDEDDEKPAEPWWQAKDADLSSVTLEQLAAEGDDVLAKRMVSGFYIAVDKTFRWNDRLWYKSTKGLVAPADRFWQTAGSKFQGFDTEGMAWKMPVGWVYGGRKTAPTYEIDADENVKPAGSVERREKLSLTGRTKTVRKVDYFELSDGKWIKDAHIRVTKPGKPPEDLQPNERWIDINLTEQTLVAFEGTVPMYATLISSGKRSSVKAKDHRTPTGSWRIREKHITTTMDGNGSAAGDLPYSIEDVPYVMYFEGSYALHGAFWHRNFGIRMSHGCVNLAPLDAKWVFFFSSPRVYKGWHGAWSSKDEPGSRIVVHE